MFKIEISKHATKSFFFLFLHQTFCHPHAPQSIRPVAAGSTVVTRAETCPALFRKDSCAERTLHKPAMPSSTLYMGNERKEKNGGWLPPLIWTVPDLKAKIQPLIDAKSPPASPQSPKRSWKHPAMPSG